MLLKDHRAIRSRPGNGLVIEGDFAFTGRHESRNQVEQRRLAAARCTQGHHKVFFMNFKIDVLERMNRRLTLDRIENRHISNSKSSHR